jgi:thiol:disulfide interchange protein
MIMTDKIKKAISTIIILMVFGVVAMQAQILEPVKWSFSHEKTGENTYDLKFTAQIDPGWSIYGIDIPPGGPIPTSFEFESPSGFEFTSPLIAPRAAVKYDPNFDMELSMYSERQVTFTRSVRVTANRPVTVKGQLVFMCCDATSCLPPDYIDFAFNLPAAGATAAAAAPGEESVAIAGNDETETDVDTDTEASGDEITIYTPVDTEQGGRSFWAMFITGLLGGMLALLTPCVFPMIPLTVSFFLRNSENRARAVRDAFFYGFTIIFSYVVLGLAISMIFGADTLNALATSPGFNLFFFFLLVFFAASFFGAFELTMPASWSTALDSKADQTGGILGVILMGFTFVLVSFSCTGPIVGTLLVDAATGGNILGPAIGMMGFSLALAIPFSLFAVFPTALKSLPKSGGWMNAVKVVLGFVVLAFSLKFLATADAVAQWGLLSREVFIVLWISIFLLLGLYLIGKIKFAHDSDLKFMSVPRLILAIISFAFVFYLLPGLWGAPLKAISSFLPSTTTQTFNISGMAGMGAAVTPSTDIYDGESVKSGPHGLLAFTDYSEGLAAARRAGKPIFLDFTGLGCANCRKMEANVWSDPQVLQRLAHDFVKISLYVDDRTPLAEEQQFVTSALGRERTIRTIGQKWSVFQAERYGVNTQPYYIILNHEEQMIAPPYGYNPSIARFSEFLEEGKSNFRN